MASRSYSIEYDKSIASASGLDIILEGSTLPSDASISKISYAVRVSSSKFTSDEKWTVEIDIGENGPSVSDTSSMGASTETLTGTMGFDSSDVSFFMSDSLSIHIVAKNSGSGSNYITYLESVIITVEYTANSEAVYLEAISDLKINGSNSYTGPGPITLTWTPPSYSGTFTYGPEISLSVEDGGSWGDSLPSPGSINSNSYTFPAFVIEHVQENNGTASIYISAWGMAGSDYISRKSNTVTFTYAESSHRTIRCYLEDSWKDCVVYYYDGSNWLECVPHYYNGSSWEVCSF